MIDDRFGENDDNMGLYWDNGRMGWQWLVMIYGGFQGGTPIAGWFIVENSNLKWWLGVPPFQETPTRFLFVCFYRVVPSGNQTWGKNSIFVVDVPIKTSIFFEIFKLPCVDCQRLSLNRFLECNFLGSMLGLLLQGLYDPQFWMDPWWLCSLCSPFTTIKI